MAMLCVCVEYKTTTTVLHHAAPPPTRSLSDVHRGMEMHARKRARKKIFLILKKQKDGSWVSDSSVGF